MAASSPVAAPLTSAIGDFALCNGGDGRGCVVVGAVAVWWGTAVLACGSCMADANMRDMMDTRLLSGDSEGVLVVVVVFVEVAVVVVLVAEA